MNQISTTQLYQQLVPAPFRSRYPYEQFAKGMIEEREHKDITRGDPVMTALIVLAHLKEQPRYYDYLDAAMMRAKQGLAPNSSASSHLIKASPKLLYRIIGLAPVFGGITGLVWVLEYVLVRRLARGAGVGDKFDFYSEAVARAIDRAPQILSGDTFAAEQLVAIALTEVESEDGLENLARLEF